MAFAGLGPMALPFFKARKFHQSSGCEDSPSDEFPRRKKRLCKAV